MLQPRRGLVGVCHGHATGLHASWWRATASRWCSVTPPSPAARFMLIQGLNGKNSSRASSVAISTISLSFTGVLLRPCGPSVGGQGRACAGPGARDMPPLGGSQDEHGLATLLVLV